jgi:hypothetical protein
MEGDAFLLGRVPRRGFDGLLQLRLCRRVERA